MFTALLFTALSSSVFAQAPQASTAAVAGEDPFQSALAGLRDERTQVRSAAADALGAMTGPDSVVPLKEALKDGDELVRLHAAQALARLGDSSGLPEAFSALTSADARARQLAANALAMAGDAQTGLPALDKAYASEKDASTRTIMDFARIQLKARLGVKESPAAAKAQSKPGAIKPKPGKEPPARKKRPNKNRPKKKTVRPAAPAR